MAYKQKHQTRQNMQFIEEWYFVHDSEVATGHLYMFSRPVPRADECIRCRVWSWMTTIVTEGKAWPRREGWQRATSARRRYCANAIDETVVTTLTAIKNT